MSRYYEVRVSRSIQRRLTTNTPSSWSQADEGQRGHYNDGYNPHPSQTPNPYDQQPQYDPYNPQQPDPQYEHQPYDPNQYHHSDPFLTPQAQPASFPPQSLPDPYQQQPSLQPQTDYLTPHVHYSPFDNSPATTRPQSGFDYEMVEREDNDLGDMPLLQRNSHYAAAPVPGSYDEATSDARSETNIRYGRIPQRVPRRYKTIKKIE